MSISRRTFPEAAGLSSLTADRLVRAAAKLPTRIPGKTGVQLSIPAFGGGSRFPQHDDDIAVEALNKALDLGVTYIDTAQRYGSSSSDRRMGEALERRRSHVFPALTVIEAKGGVLESAEARRDQKITRFIGISCHCDPEVIKTAMGRHDFDCTQMALNAGVVGIEQSKMLLNKAMATGFEKVALPVAVRKRMGIIAMKVMGQEYLIGQSLGRRFSEFVDWFLTEPKFASTFLRWPANPVAQQSVLG